jgi:hypothetical protein
MLDAINYNQWKPLFIHKTALRYQCSQWRRKRYGRYGDRRIQSEIFNGGAIAKILVQSFLGDRFIQLLVWRKQSQIGNGHLSYLQARQACIFILLSRPIENVICNGNATPVKSGFRLLAAAGLLTYLHSFFC